MWYLIFVDGVRKPDISRNPNLSVYKEHSAPITLNCSGDSNPKPTYAWFRNDSRYHILSNSSIYKISNVSINDSGTYECEVTNIVDGKMYSALSDVSITIGNFLLCCYKVYILIR